MRILFLDIFTNDIARRREVEDHVYDRRPYYSQVYDVMELTADEMDVVDATTGVFPSLDGYDGMIIGGSLEDAVEGREKPWMHNVYPFIREATGTTIPILGICGGMQFVVRALGGSVKDNPNGRNFCTNRIELLPEGLQDPLFDGLPSSIIVQSNHRCAVMTLPQNTKHLAQSPKTPFEALAIGDTIRLVQFHPEGTPSTARRHARLLRNQLINEGYVTQRQFEPFLNSFFDPHGHGKMILRNFIQHFIV